jgi:P-type E1-E2 ATPase
LGVVSFVNKLKEETRSVIERLRFEVGLNVKMITGDNIYTAVQTGFKAGIIS